MLRDGMKERSLKRMDGIVAFFSAFPGVLAVAAFGSNSQRERFDDSSDLDFLVLTDAAAKEAVTNSLSELDTLCSIDAIHIQYGDAVKLLFADGVLCDFGIVTPDQVQTFPHGAGTYLWCNDSWHPISISANEPPRMAFDDLVMDALFHLYVGLLRIARGEEAAAFYEVQVLAAQSVLTILEGAKSDAFSPHRRAERLISKDILSEIMPGYGHTFEATKAMLKYVPTAVLNPLYKAVDALLNDLSSQNT